MKIRKAAKKRFRLTKSGQLIHSRSKRRIIGQRAKKLKRMLGV